MTEHGSIHTGNNSGIGIAIGPGAQAHVHYHERRRAPAPPLPRYFVASPDALDSIVREVSPAHAAALLRQYQQSSSGTGAVGIGGSASNSPVTTGSNNTVTQSRRATLHAGGNVMQAGDDYVGGDTISVGAVSGTGIAIGRGAQAHVQQGGSGDQEAFARAFAQIYAASKARPEDPDVDKEEVTNMVKRIQQEAQQGEQANENKLTRWLRNLAAWPRISSRSPWPR